jgi:hypothetical protein
MKYMMVIEINKTKVISADSFEDAQLKAEQWAIKMGGEVMDVWEWDVTQAI